MICLKNSSARYSVNAFLHFLQERKERQGEGTGTLASRTERLWSALVEESVSLLFCSSCLGVSVSDPGLSNTT